MVAKSRGLGVRLAYFSLKTDLTPENQSSLKSHGFHCHYS